MTFPSGETSESASNEALQPHSRPLALHYPDRRSYLTVAESFVLEEIIEPHQQQWNQDQQGGLHPKPQRDDPLDQPRSIIKSHSPPPVFAKRQRQRGGACIECHTTKVKCDKVFPCSRCVRLGVDCVPHESNQGRGKRRSFRRGSPKGDGGNSKGGKQAAPSPSGEETGEGRRGSDHPGLSGFRPEENIARYAGASSLRPDHHGLSWLVRGWVSFAFRRRSFSLLTKAAGLATKAGISMDAILCGEAKDGGDGAQSGAHGGGGGVSPSMPMIVPVVKAPLGRLDALVAAAEDDGEGGNGWAGSGLAGDGNGRGSRVGTNVMDFLPSILLLPSQSQPHVDFRLRWSELPRPLLEATFNSTIVVPSIPSLDGGENEDLSPLRERLILIRAVKQGYCRYLFSPAFQRDVVSYDLLQQSATDNPCKEIFIFRPETEEQMYLRSFCRQLSHHPSPGRPPRFDPPVPTKIKMRDGSLKNAEVRFCLDIVNLDQGYYYMEFFLRNDGGVNVGRGRSHLALAESTLSAVENQPFDDAAEDSIGPSWLWDDLDDVGELNELVELLS